MNTPQFETTDRDQNKKARAHVGFSRYAPLTMPISGKPEIGCALSFEFGNFLLALGELEGAPRLGPAVLLAFHHARVAGEEGAALERAAQIGFEIGQRLGDAMTHGAGLAGP